VTFVGRDGQWHGHLAFRPQDSDGESDEVRTAGIFIEASEAEIGPQARGPGRPLFRASPPPRTRRKGPRPTRTASTVNEHFPEWAVATIFLALIGYLIFGSDLISGSDRVRSSRKGIVQQGSCRLLEVTIQDNESLERALRRFKRKVQRSGLYSELRKRRFYEKPSAQRKRKREAAIRRERRRQRRGKV